MKKKTLLKFDHEYLIFIPQRDGSLVYISIFVCFAGVPSNPKTSFDFMDGIFSDVNNTESKDTTTNTIESNLSPSVLKKKIENLQSGHQHLQTKR